MSYTQNITRQHRTAFALLLDLSGSMNDITEVEGAVMTKIEALAMICNRLLRELVMRSFRGGVVRDYYDVAVVGYSGEHITSLLSKSAQSPFVPITQLNPEADFKWSSIESLSPLCSPELIECRAQNSLLLSPEGSTPMYESLLTIYEALDTWCEDPHNRDSHPPFVIHITDGHATDCDLEGIVDICSRITSLGTNDGKVLLLNIYMGSTKGEHKLLFPTDEELTNSPNGYVNMLGRSSSILPPYFQPYIHQLRPKSEKGEYRALGYNLCVTDIISMISIGTMSVTIK